MIKEFEQMKKIMYKAPYVDCQIGLHIFKARLDTGADITIIPLTALPADALDGEKLLVRSHNGIINKIMTKLVSIEIDGLDTFTPARGVLTSEADIDLIGMDILNQCKLHISGGVFILELRKENNEFNKE